MSAEYFSGSVRLKMNLDSAKKTIWEKLTCHIYQILVAFGFISWLIVLSLFLNFGLQNLQDENKILKKEIKAMKEDLKLCNHKIGNIGEHLVEAFIPKHDRNDNLTILRKDILKKIKKDIYKKIGNYGYFYRYVFSKSQFFLEMSTMLDFSRQKVETALFENGIQI